MCVLCVLCNISVLVKTIMYYKIRREGGKVVILNRKEMERGGWKEGSHLTCQMLGIHTYVCRFFLRCRQA